MKLVLSTSLILISLTVGCGQNFDSAININYSHFTTNLGAHLSSFKVLAPEKVNIYNRSLLGLYQGDIREIYLDAKHDLPSDRALGLKVFSTQQTTELTRTKIHGFYSTKIEVSKKFDWYSGIQLGLINAYVGPTASNAGASQWAFDGSASTHFTFNGFSLGVAIHQFSNTTLRPVSYTLPLSRYLDVIFLKKTAINQEFELINGVKALLAPSFNRFVIDNQLVYNEKLSFLFALTGISGFGLSAGGGYKFKLGSNNYINLQLAFETASRATLSNANSLKINLSYSKS